MKDAMIASVEKVQAVEEFLSDWYSVSDLFETAANAANVLLEVQYRCALSDDEKRFLSKLIDQHVMLANIMKKFERKEVEV